MITSYGQSDVGRLRRQNEDSIHTGQSLFLVCDGMGGRKAGEVASSLAIATIDSALAGQVLSLDGDGQGDALKSAIRLANNAIRQMAEGSEELVGMGTTIAAVVVDSSVAEYANIGDSRIYLIRGGSISQLSRDDSWINAAFGTETADATTIASMQHVLTRALGTHEHLDFDVKRHELLDGDTLLLCSDGLTNMVTDKEIADIVTGTGSDLENAGARLVEAANKAGGRDNISVVLLRYRR